MKRRNVTHWCLTVASLGLFATVLTSYAAQKDEGKPKPEGKDRPADKFRVSVAVARDRAKLMHQIHESTLHAMHRHYFRRERAILPARAMEDVFSEIKDQSKVDTRWISVNTPAMSVNHEPETDFEIQAAKAIAEGQQEFELIEKDYYHRATPIPLGAGCISCHLGMLAPPSKTPRYAGLVISIPITEQ